MQNVMNRRWLLASYPEGMPTEDNWIMDMHPVPDPGAGARGPAGHTVDQVRAGHQRSDRQDARPHHSARRARHRRRGDRVAVLFAAMR